MSSNRNSLDLYYCCFCPNMFYDKMKLETHKQSVHRVFSKETMERFSSGRSTNFKIILHNIGTRLEVECGLCGHFVKLSDYQEHQAFHLGKKIPLSLASVTPNERVTEVKNGAIKRRITSTAKIPRSRQQLSRRAGADMPGMDINKTRQTIKNVINVLPHNGRVTCLICEGSVKKTDRISHIRTHVGSGQLRCTVCESNSATTAALRDHVNSYHYRIPKSLKVKSAKRLFKCKSCPESFRNRSDKEHHEIIHVDTPVVGNSKITRSKVSKEKIEFEVLKVPEVRARKKVTKAKPLKFQCLFCGKGFHTKVECTDHEDALADCSIRPLYQG